MPTGGGPAPAPKASLHWPTGAAAPTASPGAPALVACDPVTGQPIRATRASANRCEHDHPESLIHVNGKKIDRIPDDGGRRLLGRVATVDHRHKKVPASYSYSYVHAAIDDRTRPAYAEMLTDERGTTGAGFLTRAGAFFAGHGISVKRAITRNANLIRPHPGIGGQAPITRVNNGAGQYT